MYSIQLIIDKEEKEKLSEWIEDEFHATCKIVSDLGGNDRQVLFVEINRLLDWMIIHRMRKQNKDIVVFPVIDKEMLHTAPIAMQLNASYLFVKPLKKNCFVRNVKRVLAYEKNVASGTEDSLVPLQEVFLRSVLRGEVISEREFTETNLFPDGNAIPNTVFFIQGFVKDEEREERDGWQAPQLIQQALKRQLLNEAGQVFFVPYRKHLLMLLRLPSVYVSPRFWKQGETAILKVIGELEEKYGIHLYIGAGSIYSEPQMLHHSYKEAGSARRTPPYQRLQLRYFEETAKDPQIQKSIEYITKYYGEGLTATEVAAHINFSPTYFSRLFKKETGRSFVEYVTFVRLQRAIYRLRHTDLTIEQIADETGFNTPNYFSNIFKRYAGLAPTEYRATKEILFV
ncbi:helix-turn-helix domain-containing protein [Mesobacillus zeae]|uniref:AraC family transcriptional regulator n=2 Tax=Mesobacillus zeae TaxID=1917180 RepID=A0A398AXK5_9BACI|nr:helix-turn-helix domain-containing protein [Mesobacillus zeae]RID82315.1 AraC family transcriptional regulator [Mesobacillus zeae]